MTFVFRLERVLEYRKSLERDAEGKLARARREYQERFAALETARRNLEQSMAAGMPVDVGMSERSHRYLYLQHLKTLMFHWQQEVQRAAEQVEKERDLLMKAMRERQVMEKLKERDLKTYRKEVEAKERALEDELALYSFVRRKKNKI